MPRISLSDVVGRNVSAGNRLPDTLKLKLGLERLGYYEPNQRGFLPGADDELWYGLESYQRERGLDVDGVALPNGPTVSALNDDLDQARPASLITGTFDAPLSPEAVASNRRTVRALRSFRGVGDLPTFAVSALRSGDPVAPAEIADLLARSQQEAPEQAQQLRDALAEYMDHDDLSRLDAAARERADAARGGDVVTPAAGNTDEALKQRFYDETLKHEGGYADRPAAEDRGGPTDRGLSTRALEGFRKQYPEWNLPSDPRKLTGQQRRQVFDTYYDTMRIGKWVRMSGLADQAPRLGELIYDSAVLHGTDDPGKWLQQALDEQLGTDLRLPLKDGSIGYDGIIGPDTRDAMEQAIKDGKMSAVYDATLAKREAYARGLGNAAGNPGWIRRFESFRRR
jgi:lysozyme family protein